MEREDVNLADPMDVAAGEAAAVMKALSNPARLRLLCALVPGELSVGVLVERLGESQAYVSNQLGKLRAEGLVSAQKDGRVVRYQLADARVRAVLMVLYEVFCPDP